MGMGAGAYIGVRGAGLWAWEPPEARGGLNSAPGARPVRVLSACGGLSPAPGARPVP